MLGDLMKIILASLREVDIRILMVITLRRRRLVTSPTCSFFLATGFFLEPRGWCSMLEVKLMLVISLFNLLIEIFRPLLEILDIISDSVILLDELLIAFGLDILLVAGDYGVIKVVLRPRVILE